MDSIFSSFMQSISWDGFTNDGKGLTDPRPGQGVGSAFILLDTPAWL